jgi:hypothetical protein
VVARWRQGVAGELVETTRRAPDNKSGGGDHRGQRLGATARGGVLVGGRVDGDSG